jgi:hypothetical protein
MSLEPIVLPSVMIGLASSCITELLKYIPFLAETKERKRILALVVSVLITIAFVLNKGILDWEDAIGSLMIVIISSFSTYKAIIKTLFPKD